MPGLLHGSDIENHLFPIDIVIFSILIFIGDNTLLFYNVE